jgi:hypothetical protein
MATTDENLTQLVFNRLSKAKYEELKAAGQLNANEFYITPDESVNQSDFDDAIALKANAADVEAALELKANKSDVEEALALKADASAVYTKEEVDAKVSAVYRVKGSVDSYDALPTADQIVGDVYNVLDTGSNYVWTESGWDKLSETVDLSGYSTTEEIEAELAKKVDSETYATDKAALEAADTAEAEARQAAVEAEATARDEAIAAEAAARQAADEAEATARDEAITAAVAAEATARDEAIAAHEIATIRTWED